MDFSINDKIVVYDRVRENLTRFKKMPLAELIDLSINETLTRTIGTSVALFLAIVPLALSVARPCASLPSSYCSAWCWRPAPPYSLLLRSCSTWERNA